MYLAVKNQLKHFSVREYQSLITLCRLSKNLYNEALYSVRHYYFAERVNTTSARTALTIKLSALR